MNRISALLCCLLSCALSAQDSAAPKFASLQGIVVKEPGSDPVKKALIELIAEGQSDGGNYTALSAPDGSFRIENIAPGRYRLFVERTGYQEIGKRQHSAEGRVLTFVAGKEVKDLVIRLQAAAVVEGRVTDEDGDPMPEAQVAVHRQTFVTGHGRWEQVAAERTNDLGEYRISGLVSGQYFISVTPPPDFKSLIETSGSGHRENAPSAEKPALAYQTVFYPGTRDRGQAAPIQLHPGDDFPANFSLTPGPSLTIRGSVVLPQGATAAVMLQSKDFNLVLNGAEMRKDGNFEIRDVAPGDYTLIATVDSSPVPMMARQPLQLASANVEGLRLAPQAGGSIRGRLRMETNAAAKADPSRIFLVLRSSDGDDETLGTVAGGLSSAVAHVNSDGSFEWKNVPAGHYSIQISEASEMPDWFLKSVLAGGSDATDSGFSVSGGAITVDLVASANGAAVEGTVVYQHPGSETDGPNKDEPVADAVVVAVPEARFRNHPERYRKVVSDQRGQFLLRGLPPGDYTLFAWESVDGEAYYDPQFLRVYEGQGKAFHAVPGDHATFELKVISSPQNEP
jgi:hypothetical protein